MAGNGKLIIVSNRLPVRAREKEGHVEFYPSEGGLATGLNSFYREYGAVWVGWPGHVPKNKEHEMRQRLMAKHRCHPVFLSKDLVEKYYEGFSNSALWPILHSFPSYARYSSEEWDAYKEANRLFCDAVLQTAHHHDTIWVQDYQLLLLPRMLRDARPKMKIGFFLHIPFPPYDTLRSMPQCREILNGILGADLIGFHTYDYAQAFLASVRRLLGPDNNLGQISMRQRIVQTDVFPMGIDFQKFAEISQSPSVLKQVEIIRGRMGPLKLIFSVSRLDYTKGIPHSLEAIEKFLESHPEWHRKMVYLLSVVPSREKVETYAQLKKTIDELVGRINSRFSRLDWVPIRYIYRSLNFEELCALYYSADVALITPLRDGMNLIVKEFLATKSDNRGVAIVSEMAGVARELVEAVIVNPNSREEMAEALLSALTMPEEEQIRRNEPMRNRLAANGVKNWAGRFLEKLDSVHKFSTGISVRILNAGAQKKLAQAFRKARRRLILLDYDGTLMPFAPDPSQAAPSPRVIKLLENLSRIPDSWTVLISGRERMGMEQWFSGLDLTLVAEHGGWHRSRLTRRWQTTIEPDEEWKVHVRPIMEIFEQRIPGSFIEEKTFSLAWHYRRSDADISSDAAREMVDTLTNLTANLELQVLRGSKVVEIRQSGISKGTFYSRFFADSGADFVLAAGDDWTDESLFKSLPPSAYSIRVGYAPSAAHWHADGPQEIVSFLSSLAASSHTAQMPLAV